MSCYKSIQWQNLRHVLYSTQLVTRSSYQLLWKKYKDYRNVKCTFSFKVNWIIYEINYCLKLGSLTICSNKFTALRLNRELSNYFLQEVETDKPGHFCKHTLLNKGFYAPWADCPARCYKFLMFQVYFFLYLKSPKSKQASSLNIPMLVLSQTNIFYAEGD